MRFRGTADQARRRDAIVLASGPRESVRRCEAVFEGFARAHHYLGEFGAGSKMKFLANHLVSIHNAAAAEAFVLAREAGLDLGLVRDVIADGAGQSRMFEVRFPRMIERDYEGGAAIGIFEKDIAAIGGFARGLGCATPLLDTVSGLYDAAAAAGYGGQDAASLREVLDAMRPGAPAG